jgi:hypothetical protein
MALRDKQNISLVICDTDLTVNQVILTNRPTSKNNIKLINKTLKKKNHHNQTRKNIDPPNNFKFKYKNVYQNTIKFGKDIAKN